MNQDILSMDFRRVQLAVCWIALMMIYLLGDVLRLYEKGQAAALIDGKPMNQSHLLMAALLMLTPILLAMGLALVITKLLD